MLDGLLYVGVEYVVEELYLGTELGGGGGDHPLFHVFLGLGCPKDGDGGNGTCVFIDSFLKISSLQLSLNSHPWHSLSLSSYCIPQHFKSDCHNGLLFNIYSFG